MSDFYSARLVTARKFHRCEACGRSIEPGQTYRKIAQRIDGEFDAIAMHDECDTLWRLLYVELDYAGKGMPWDIGEALSGGLNSDEAQEVLDSCRGWFPHAVTRIEFTLRERLEGGE